MYSWALVIPNRDPGGVAAAVSGFVGGAGSPLAVRKAGDLGGGAVWRGCDWQDDRWDRRLFRRSLGRAISIHLLYPL